MTIRLLFIVCLLSVGHTAQATPSAARPQRADPLANPKSQTAQQYLVNGNKLYAVRDFERAIEQYKAGALVEPAPVFDYNLGQCYRNLGKYTEALWHYRRFLDNGEPDGEVLEAVNNFIDQMKSELDRRAMSQPPNNTGPVSSAEPAVREPAAPQPVVAPGVPSGVTTIPSRDARNPEPNHRWYHDRVGWGLAGAGAVGLAVGAGLLLDASSLRGDANASRTQSDYKRLAEKADSRELVGVAVGVAGLGLAAAGAIKLTLHSGSNSRDTAWNVTGNGNGVVVFGTF